MYIYIYTYTYIYIYRVNSNGLFLFDPYAPTFLAGRRCVWSQALCRG